MIRRLLLAALLLPGLAAAETRTLAPGDDLGRAVAAAAPAGALVLAAGTHAGRVTLDRPLTLSGEPGAILDGGGAGSVLTVDAAGATVTGLTIRASGSDRVAMDAGVFLTRAGELHDSRNMGIGPCHYLVFEFHAMVG